jgi:hypothetical protein
MGIKYKTKLLPVANSFIHKALSKSTHQTIYTIIPDNGISILDT